MASYLVIKNESSINRYLCKTTHDSIPYIKISTNDTGGYLDLTTASTTGMRLNLSNVTESGTLTSSSSSQYDETTGYSGVSSKESTSGYTGVSSKSSTSGYTGYLSRSSTSGYTGKAKSTWNNLPASQTGASNKLTRTTSSNYSFKSFAYAIIINVRTTVAMFSSAYQRYGNVLHLVTSRTSTTDANNMDGKLNIAFAVVDSQLNNTRKLVGGPPFQQTGLTMNTGTIIASHDFKHDSAASGTLSVKMNSLIRGKQTITSSIATYFNIASITLQENVQPCYSGYSSSSNTVYSSSVTTNAALSSTTALTRSSAYLTSSEVIGNLSSTTALTRSSSYSSSSVDVGNLSSTTALTRSSSYNTSSSTTNAGISSTTALITTSSRSEEYETETHYTTHYRPCNTKSITVPKTISLESSYYTGVKSVGGAGTLTITRSSQYDETIGYSGVESKSSTSGYTGKSKVTNYAQASQRDASNTLALTTAKSSIYEGQRVSANLPEDTGVYYIFPGGAIAAARFTTAGGNTTFSNTTIKNLLLQLSRQTTNNAIFTLESFIHTGNGNQLHFPRDLKLTKSTVINANNTTFTAQMVNTTSNNTTASTTLSSMSWINASSLPGIIAVTNSAQQAEARLYFTDFKYVFETFNVDETHTYYYGSSSATNTAWGSSSTTNEALSSTTALTRSSAYNVSSSTTNENLSSTTALTTTSSRSSEYTIPAGGTYTMSSHTSNWQMSSMGTSTRESTSYTTSVNAIADEED